MIAGIVIDKSQLLAFCLMGNAKSYAVHKCWDDSANSYEQAVNGSLEPDYLMFAREREISSRICMDVEKNERKCKRCGSSVPLKDFLPTLL
jgi:hypothetical protein